MSNRKLLSLITGIVILGFLLRVVFLLFGAELYFGREDFFISGDTSLFVKPVLNLIEHGVYSFNLNHPDGYFTRTPGYPFIIGIFHMISGKNLDLTYKLLIWFQVFLDSCAIFLIYKIGVKLFGNERTGLILGFLYATYPFVIVWNPVVYAESSSIFFLLLSIFYFIDKGLKYHFVFSGIFLAVALLIRPQIALAVPCYLAAIVYQHRSSLLSSLWPSLLFLAGLFLMYLPWPIRNYLGHDKLVLAHNYEATSTLKPDVIAFWNYIFALKAEWEPQFSAITHNKSVAYPKAAYIFPGDSVKLEQALQLSKTCGSGFSNWKGYWKQPITDDNCDTEIAVLFDELRAHQIQYNKMNYYVKVPLQNLKKAVFKSVLYDQKSTARSTASFLFHYRTLLIIMGVIGSILMIIKPGRSLGETGVLISSIVILSYWYLTWIHRNIEIRYFLPADVLLLIPSAYFLSQLYSVLIVKNGDT